MAGKVMLGSIVMEKKHDKHASPCVVSSPPRSLAQDRGPHAAGAPRR